MTARYVYCSRTALPSCVTLPCAVRFTSGIYVSQQHEGAAPACSQRSKNTCCSSSCPVVQRHPFSRLVWWVPFLPCSSGHWTTREARNAAVRMAPRTDPLSVFDATFCAGRSNAACANLSIVSLCCLTRQRLAACRSGATGHAGQPARQSTTIKTESQAWKGTVPA